VPATARTAAPADELPEHTTGPIDPEVKSTPALVDVMDAAAATPELAAEGGPNRTGSMRRAYSEMMGMDTTYQKRHRPTISRHHVLLMRDFSDSLPPEYRAKYLAWRKGEPRGAKGEATVRSRHEVTLVYDKGSLESQWHLHLVDTPRRALKPLHLMATPRRTPPTRPAYLDGYATWKLHP